MAPAIALGETKVGQLKTGKMRTGGTKVCRPQPSSVSWPVCLSFCICLFRVTAKFRKIVSQYSEINRSRWDAQGITQSIHSVKVQPHQQAMQASTNTGSRF